MALPPPRRFSNLAPLDPATRKTLSDELYPPFLGGPSIASRAQLHRRTAELLAERGGECAVRRSLPLPVGPAYRGMSLNQLSLYGGGRPYYDTRGRGSGSLAGALFVPTSGHPALKQDGVFRVQGSGRVCRKARLNCDGTVTGYSCY